MQCRTIHSSGCDTELLPGWKFCPGCGRRAGGLSLAASKLVFHPAHEGVERLALEHFGSAEVRFVARLAASSEDGPLQLLDAQNQPVPGLSDVASLGRAVGLRFGWTGAEPPPIAGSETVELEMVSDDGPPLDPFETGQNNRRRGWEKVWIQATSPQAARLEIKTQVALFSEAVNEREITLLNGGEVPLSLQALVPPPGYEIHWPGAPPESVTIAPFRSRHLAVRRLGEAPRGLSKLAFHDLSGVPLGEVPLLLDSRAPIENRTQWVVGVDFGTSGTSVWLRDGCDDRLPARALLDSHAQPEAGDDAARFPSVLYLRFEAGRETGFFIGYAAVQAHRADQQSKHPGRSGLFVSELKSWLRRDDEPFTTDYGPGYTLDALLRRFLERLLTEVIAPATGGAGVSIAWNFSIPVLDKHRGGSGQLFEKQRVRMEKAIRAANFVGPNCSLEFFTEPFCAAVYLLLGHGQFRFPANRPPRAGDWVCVFDSGGGTTDVVLGRLDYEAGKLRFEEVSSLGVTRDENGLATFGGESLTRRTAIYLALYGESGAKVAKYDYLKYASFVPNDPEIYNRLRRIALHAVKERDDSLLLGLSPQNNDRAWLEAGDDILGRTDQIKRAIAGLGTPSASAQIRLPARQQGLPDQVLRVPRAEFDEQVVEPRLRPFLEAIQSQVFGGEGLPAPAEVAWVFGVGGNSRVTRINDSLQALFPNGLQRLEVETPDGPDDSDRLFAVSGGAVWASKARRDDAIPYSLRVVDENETPVFSLALNEPLSLRRDPTHCVRSVQSGKVAAFRVLIEGRCAGNEFDGEVGRFALVNAARENGDSWRSLTATFRVEAGKLVVTSDDSTPARVVWEYWI